MDHHHQCVWPHFEHTECLLPTSDSTKENHRCVSPYLEVTQPLLPPSDITQDHHQCVWPHFEQTDHLLPPPPDRQTQHKRLEKCFSCPKGMDSELNGHRSAKKSNSAESGRFVFRFKDKKSGWIRKRYPSGSWPSERR